MPLLSAKFFIKNYLEEKNIQMLKLKKIIKHQILG